jgi:hypothetical protein
MTAALSIRIRVRNAKVPQWLPPAEAIPLPLDAIDVGQRDRRLPKASPKQS